MKTLSLTLFLSLFISSPVMAGAGHDHGHSHSQGPVSSTEVIKRATKKVTQMANAGKIDKQWSTTEASGAQQKSFAKGPEWVITFNNDNVGDASKRKLYLFFSLDGHYIAANYTGN